MYLKTKLLVIKSIVRLITIKVENLYYYKIWLNNNK